MAEVTFGEWLKRQRGAMGWSQKQLALQLACSLSALRKMEAEERRPSAQVIERLAKLFNIPQDERKSFLRFARGDWQAFLGGETDETPWRISGATLRSNLPASITSFIGRDKEQAEIARLLSKQRLVTIAGVGGIGKTSFVIQVGQKLLNEYPNGVWFVSLASLFDTALVTKTVASIFDIREGSSDQPIIERLIFSLSAKSALLILDNCEHLLDACTQLITTLLQRCPSLKILTTSREALNMDGEALYYLPTLSIPDKKMSLEKLKKFESVNLFTERARLALPSFRLTYENAQTIVDICRRVDGIPLAIELAAVRLNVLQVEEILKQLQDSFRFLTGNSRALTPRHKTLHASLAWSWGLLSEAEQFFMQQLSIFAGGWTLEAVQAVCEGDILSLTDALAKKSLIVVDQHPGRETRYRFHEIVRQYAREKLVEVDKEKDIRTRHLQYFLQLSEQAEIALRGPTPVKWYERLNDDRANIHAALEWAARTNVEAGLYLSGRLNIFWELFDIRGGLSWLEVFIQNPESKSYPRARAKALRAQSLFLFWFERFAEARLAVQESLGFYKTYDDKQGEIDSLLVSAFLVENMTEAREILRHALGFAQSINDKWRQARILTALGWGVLEDKQHLLLKEALKIFQDMGDLYNTTEVMAELGRLEMLMGNLESAQKILNEVIILIRPLNLKNSMAGILQETGRIATIKGNYEQAYANLQESATIYEEQGIRTGYLFSRAHLGHLTLRQGDTITARSIFSETAKDFYMDQNENGVMFTLEVMGGLSMEVGKPKIAAQLIGWADMVREKLSDPRPPIEQVDVNKIIATCITKMGKERFSNAYNEGQKMTMDEAVKLALEES